MSETGHARNVGNFETLISNCTGFGPDFNPANPALEIVSMTAKHAACQIVMDAVSESLAEQKIEINNRQTEFEGIRKLTTRVVNVFEAGGASEKDVDDARSFKRKIDGARAKALDEPAPGEPPVEDNSISVSQQSYVQLVEHFTNLINLLDKSGVYNPNETELQLTQLQAKRDAMEAANTAVIGKLTATANARIERNEEMYAPNVGLYDIAMLCKKYIKALFGTDSPQYALVSGLRFDRY